MVIWDRNPCFNKYLNRSGGEICGEGAKQMVGERLNIERYIGIGCQCDQFTLESDGFKCDIPCDRSKHKTIMRECRKKKKECHINRKSKEAECGCPMGFNAKAENNGIICESYDPCLLCRHKCHKASKCLPATADSVFGYSCAPCDPQKGYSGNGFMCYDIDECSDDRLNDCDLPNAECENREPIYDNGLKYVCFCKEGWMGDPKGGYKWRRCLDTNECQNSTACGENTICENTPGSYICNCKPGFIKKPADPRTCDDIDECMLNKPCHYKAKCTNTPGSYSCKCDEGYLGDGIKTCEPDKNYFCKVCEKATTDCVLNSANDGYNCKCKKGFQPIPGSNEICQDIANCADPNLNDCDKRPGHAECKDTPGSYNCKCSEGFEGDGRNCTAIDPCVRSNPCASIAGTVCTNKNGVAKCECKSGFVRQIKHQMNESAPCFDEKSDPVNNCTHCNNMTSICHRIGNGPFYECICSEGYQMNAVGTCVNINECMQKTENDCDSNANCVDLQPALDNARYKCVCKPGFTGKGTQNECKDIDECKEVMNACPLPKQKCINTLGGYQCGCEEGFRKNPGSDVCADINECEEGTAKCAKMSKCFNRVPGFTCECMNGFRNVSGTNGTYICENIDECKDGINGKAACDADHGKCVDTYGSHICGCKEGFTIGTDMKTCIDKDECKDGEDRCNKQIENCVNTIGNYTCDCKYGLTKVNDHCEDRNECTDGSNKCLKNSICINTFASYKCVCEQGFKTKVATHALRPVCEREDICANYPTICMPGQCESIKDEPYYKCICPSSAIAISPTRCVNPNYCDKNFPCPVNASCFTGQCACDIGYTWQEITDFPLSQESLLKRPPCKEVNPCAESDLCAPPLKCKHTGPGNYICECDVGYELSGSDCIDIDECNLKVNSSECPQNTHCLNLPGSYKCECRKGYTAKVGSSLTNPTCLDVNECEAGLDDCAVKNATCVNSIGTFSCECAEGYGKYAPDYKDCKDIDECATGVAKCDPNAFCKNVDGSYECECKRGYNGDGQTCFDIDECDPANRQDNCDDEKQECVNTEGSFKCKCKKGYVITTKGCEDVNECLNADNNDCGKKGGIVRMKCVNQPGGYMCICPSGYTETSNDRCEDIDECKSDPPVCPDAIGNLCVNKNGTYSCECLDGYRKPKNCAKKANCVCENIDECKVGIKRNGKTTRACGKGAKCTDTPGSFTCECAPGYSGDAFIDGCSLTDACKANDKCDKATQVCKSVAKEAICDCKPGFVKELSGKCVKNPCSMNNGGCGKGAECRLIRRKGKIKAECRCKEGFELDKYKNCQVADKCKCKPKVPFGTPCKSLYLCKKPRMLCVNYGSNYTCVCDEGFKLSSDGQFCENIDECKEGVDNDMKKENKACDDKATCIDTIGSYICECPRGQIEDHAHKCKIDTPDCSRENNCTHDPNAYCARIDETHQHCKCKAGFKGAALNNGKLCAPEDHCKNLKKRKAKICMENEICVNEQHRHKCECKRGFMRSDAKSACKDIDECASGEAYCPPTFVCKNTIGSFNCVCPTGYTMSKNRKKCVDINECKIRISDKKKFMKAKCKLPMERCENLPGSYKCVCNSPAFIKGPTGCVDNDECANNQFDCPEYSSCVNRKGGYSCKCDPGFKPMRYANKTLKACVDIDECHEKKDACPAIADCINHDGSYECKCKPPAVQHGLLNCVVNASCPDACHRNAYCLQSSRDGGEVYNCTCNVGYTGDGTTNCDPIDECKTGTAICHKNADCIDKDPLYECRCKEPYQGDGKNICEPEKVCETRNDCPSGAKCIPLFPNQKEGKWVTCKCKQGFRFNEKTRECDDINECKANKGLGPCSKKVKGIQCVNTQGSFYCKCPEGYKQSTKNNRECDDVDECKDGLDECGKTHGKCKNLRGTYECICPAGFKQSRNKKKCLDIDECAEKNNTCDPGTTICKNTIGSYECSCNKKGFAKIPGKRDRCEDVNECVLNTHDCKQNSELCHNTIGSYKCNCSNGYEKKNGVCVPSSNCKPPQECGANAFCVMRPSRENPAKLSPECVCQDGYYGTNPKEFCDPVADCENDNQCPSNSKCVETQAKDSKGRASFTCVCNKGYRKVGSQCEAIKTCEENPGICGRNAICVGLNPFYKCVCDSDTIDKSKSPGKVKCEIPSCKDATNPCDVNARCIDSSDGYSCKCKEGYTGVGTARARCEPIDFCGSYCPCSQYANCVNEPPGSFKCTCNSGYKGNGTICHDINECEESTTDVCDAKAKCLNKQGSFLCKCKDGYEGEGRPGMCRDVDECSSPRLNKCDTGSSTCRNTDGSFECSCKPGYRRAKNNNYSCDDINECLDNKEPICGEHFCNNLPGDYRCDCRPGFKLLADGHGCQDINECENRPCHTNAECINTPGSYMCTCKQGYEGDGEKKCSPINKCLDPSKNQCNNATTICKMVPKKADYFCECLPGYDPPQGVSGVYYSCNDIDECTNGNAKYNPLTQDCVNTEGSFRTFCKVGYILDDSGECVDKDECAEDSAYFETLVKFKQAEKKPGKINWRELMVEPKNSSSAYAICYQRAVSKKWWWFTSASSPLPFCKNTPYEPRGAFNGNIKVMSWKGFECDCAPNQKRSEQNSRSSNRIIIKCEEVDPCTDLQCDSVGEGFICDRQNRRCACDRSAGYIQRVSVEDIPFCTKDECTRADVLGPSTVENIQHRSMISCDYDRKKWRPVKGYTFLRNKKTNDVIGLRDINECLDDHYCCNRTKAMCDVDPGKCTVKCANFDGGASCYCDRRNPDVDIDRETCQCKARCSLNSAWYLNCNKDKIQCDFTKLQKLLDAKTAPKSTVCSRLSTYDGQFLTFGSMTELLKEICNTKAYCAMPPYEIDDIRELPAFNYEGPCHETKALLEKVKCPFGDKPMVMEGLSMLYAYCPYKIDLSRYPGPDPSHLRRASRSASPMKCLPEGNTLDERTNFYRSMDEKSYYLEVV